MRTDCERGAVMKQIFDWLREQCFGNVKLNGNSFAEIYRIIDEAEAKWEADCCEWKNPKNCKHIFKSHDKIVADSTLLSWWYCPYCGKRIKISEVE